MTPELQKQYEDSCVPFVDGAIGVSETKMHSWRYFLEINSACNLSCPTCTKGNMDETAGLKYEHQNGIMDDDLMQKCIDKIRSENQQAIVFLYGNSEPFLHPRLIHCIQSVKARGLNCQLSTNLNVLRNLDEFIAAKPDFVIISLSGFTQDVYVRGHAGGNIEKVKSNMALLGDALYKAGNPFPVSVCYHVYDYNRHEIALMEEYAKAHNIGFFSTIARAISMENSIQYCRSKDAEATPFEVQEGIPDWNHLLPPVTRNYLDIMQHVQIRPDHAREMYKDIPISEVCPVGAGSIFTYIRHDGKTQLCACTADRRITIGNYLEMTTDEMMSKRVGHSVCKQCIKYRLNLYYMINMRSAWDA
jgi:MoaA/NifB/PqqE/SkfB family radical SAM enzyme